MASQRRNSGRLEIVAIFCIILGLLIGMFIKRVQVGLIIGIALGLLGSNMWIKSK